MKEKIKIKTIVCCLMMTSMLLGLGACNNEDDVMEIFNNKTWKLVRIATEKGKEQFYQGLWSNESKEEIDRELNTFGAEGNYTLNFNCAEVNGEVTGTVNVHAVNSSINDAVLKIDGKEHTISIKPFGMRVDRPLGAGNVSYILSITAAGHNLVTKRFFADFF